MRSRSSDWTPFASFVHAVRLLLTGRVRLRPQELGWVYTDDAGRRFTVIRSLVVQSPGPTRGPCGGGVVVARFRVAAWAAWLVPVLSWAPIPFFIGLPGFVSKRWMIELASGEACGYYEWATEEDAARYTRSFAARFMAARAEPGSASFRWYPAAAAPLPPRPSWEAVPRSTEAA